MSDADICGGDLYRLQKEAAERARRTASRSCQRDEPAPRGSAPSCAAQELEQEGQKGIFNSADAVIVGVIVLILLNDGCNDMLLLLALAVLLIM